MSSDNRATDSSYILNIDCVDTKGIVAAVATFLTHNDAFITESSHYGDADTGRFFMRTVFRSASELFASSDTFGNAFQPLTSQFDMNVSFTASSRRPRVVIAVSKAGHCLNHLLHKWQSNELPIDVVGVVSNHDDFRSLVTWYDIPYYHLPIDKHDKTSQETRFLEVVETLKADLVVLARYMQIMSDDMTRVLSGRCINIHHSFLPSFKGARPYHQAHQRGVKVIGATAHYVTADLDEGPIIEQDTVRVDHTLTADEFVRVGKDVESIVLARAVRWHAERRVLLNGDKIVVFK